MDENKNEPEVDIELEAETPEADLTPETDWEAEAKKARGIAQRLRTKLTKAEEKKVAVETPTAPIKETAPKTGELDETQLDYLDLKGVTDQDEIDIIQKVIAKTGQTVRQALKDDYVQSKLDALRKDKAVKDATPSSTKRGGSQTGDLAQALAKFEQNGELPTDFALRSAVVNAKADKENTNKPAWH
jgi:hypothetical protein